MKMKIIIKWNETNNKTLILRKYNNNNNEIKQL